MRPNFLDGPSRHPDLCVRYVRIWPHAAEGKSRTAFLAPDASMVVATHHTVGGRLVLFRGLRIPEEPLGGYIPLSLTGGHIPRAFATILSNRCVLFARWGVAAALPCLAEHPPTTHREVFVFDKRVSRCVSCVGHFGDPGTERWSFWRLSEGGSVATIPFGIGIRAFVCPSWSRRFFFSVG